MQLSVQLSGVCESSDSLFVVVFGGKLSEVGRGKLSKQKEEIEEIKKNNPTKRINRASVEEEVKKKQKQQQQKLDIDLANLEWMQLGRTEVVKPKDAGAMVNRTASRNDVNDKRQQSMKNIQANFINTQHSTLVCRQFSLMVNEPKRFGLEIVMFAVYKNQGNSDLLGNHTELAWGIMESGHISPNEYIASEAWRGAKRRAVRTPAGATTRHIRIARFAIGGRRVA